MTLAVKVNCQHLEFFMVWPPHSASSMQRITHFSHTLHTYTQCGDMLPRVLVERVTCYKSVRPSLISCNVRISLGVKSAATQKYHCVYNQLQHENITMCNFSCNARMSLCVKLTTTQKCHCVSNQQQHENITVCLMFWCW